MYKWTEVIRHLNMQINRKLLFTKSFAITCYFLAGYYSILQVLDYMKNEDVSLLTYKKYNVEPTDRYPTFSICLDPTDDDILDLYQEETIQQHLNISVADYFDMLTGGSIRDDGLTNFSLLQFDDAKRELLKMISIYTMKNRNEEPLVYWDPDVSNASELNSLFYHGYQGPDRFCFTRNNSYIPSKQIIREIVYLDVENWVGDLYFYLHYPGQLITGIEQGETTRLSLEYSDLSETILKIGISQTQVLKKRHDSRIPCDRDYESNVDLRWRESVMGIVGCIPTYWRGLPQSLPFRSHNFNDCTKAQQYKSFYDYNLYTTDSNITYEPSCTWAKIFSDFLFEDREDGLSGFVFELKHESQYYEEVKNLKATRFYDLWSQIGGLVGIFLGCSLIQIPGFASKLFSVFNKPLNN